MTRKTLTPLPSQILLKENLLYEEESGVLRWKLAGKHRKIGGQVGYLQPNGYLITTLFGGRFLVHRIIWKMLYDEEPEEIDHVNGVRWDNRRTNLRAADMLTNQHNMKIFKNNTTGIKGLSVFTAKSGIKFYRAEVCCNYIKHRHNFPFTNEGKEEAINWLRATREVLHGQFAKHG